MSADAAVTPASRSRLQGGRDRQALALLPLRLFLAAGWLRATAEKVISPEWWSGETLRAFLLEHQDSTITVYQPFVDLVVEPGATAIAIVVALLEAMVGISLLSGRRVREALMVAIFLNLHFVLAGMVNPSVFYLVMEFTLLVSATAGCLSLRRAGALLTDQRTDLTDAFARFRAHPKARWTLLPLAISVVFIVDIRTVSPEMAVEEPALLLILLGLLATTVGVIRCAAAPGRLAAGSTTGKAEPIVLSEVDDVSPDAEIIDLRQRAASETRATETTRATATRARE